MKLFLLNHRNKLDEIVFENRNKDYGAYAIRQEADAVLTKALLISGGILLTLCAVPWVVRSLTPDKVALPTQDIGSSRGVLLNITEPEVIVPQKMLPPVKQYREVDTQLPEPTRHIKGIEKPAVSISERQNAINGTQETAGESVHHTVVVQGNSNTTNEQTTVAPMHKVDAPPLDLDFINTKVDVQASYSGGVEAFRKAIMTAFPVDEFEGEENVFRTEVSFVVERDGSISQIKATGTDKYFNTQAVNTVKKIKGKWEPAKIKGVAVRSYFKIPISMKFE